MRRLARTSAFIYAGLFTVFALLSGSGSVEGENGFLANLPNVLPWLLTWAVLFAAWKNPTAGGVIFFALAAAFTIFFHACGDIFLFLLIGMPLVLIGIMFKLDSRRKLWVKQIVESRNRGKR